MAELIVEATIDSVLNRTQPDQNYGANPAISQQVTYDTAGKTSLFRGFGNFDVSALVGATINSARLLRECYSITNGGQPAWVVRSPQPLAVTELGITWNKYDGVNDWVDPGGGAGAAAVPPRVEYTDPLVQGLHQIDGLGPFVRDALANRAGIVSIITRLVNEDPSVTTQVLWRSKEYGSDVWRLVIDYMYTPVVEARSFGVIMG